MRTFTVQLIIFLIIPTSLKSEISQFFGSTVGGFHLTKEKQGKADIISKENIQNNNYIFFYSTQIINNKSEVENNKIFYNINPILKVKEDESKKLSFYSGDNLYLGYKLNNFSVIVGRMPFSNFYRADNIWKDGIEGITIESEFKNGSNLKLYLFDYYRGFIQFKNEFFIEKENTFKGNRFRSGLEYNIPLKFLFINFHSTYLNLGNWGKYSNDDPKRVPQGDNDYLYFNSLSLNYKKNYFSSTLTFLSSRGVDRSSFNQIRNSKNLLTTGEALQLFIDYRISYYQLSTSFFLPDSNKVNSQGEILESGYTGMGSYYSEGFLLSQYINFLPANWVTQNGLERNSTIYNSRQNSFFGKLKVSYLFDSMKLSLFYEKYIPYKNNRSLNGEIYFDKKYYSPESISELSFAFEYKENKNSSLFFKIQISRLISEFLDKTHASSIYFTGGLQF